MIAAPHARWVVLIAAGSGALVVAFTLAILVGPSSIEPGEVARILLAHLTFAEPTAAAGTDAIVWQIRLPRALVALLVGAILATAGACYQSLFRNPLADPYLVGVASGAGIGVALALVLPFGASMFGLAIVTPAAFVGALAAVLIAYRLAGAEGMALPATLMLAGVAIAYVGGAAISLMFLIDGQRFLTIFGWLLGGFNGTGWAQVAIVAGYGLPAMVLIAAHARALNVLQLDDDQAMQLGVEVASVRRRLIIAASLGTAAAVSVAGLIGFVGLIVPHVARMLVGADARRAIPVAMLGGSIFMLLADLVARTIIAPAGVPVGIITTLLGGPFFLALLRRRRSFLE